MNNAIPDQIRRLSPEQMKQDIDRFTDLYQRVHPRPLAEFPIRDPGESLSRLKDHLTTPLSRLEFYRRLGPLVNGTGDEHTHLMLPDRELTAQTEQGGVFFPFDVRIVEGHTYLAAARDGHDQGLPPGAELVSINARPMSEMLPVLLGFFSGTSARQREFFLETSFPEALFLGYGPEAKFTVEYAATEATPLRRADLAGCPIVPVPHKTDFPILNESPLRYRNDNQFRRLGEKALLLEFRAFENPGGKFTRLVETMFEVARNEGRDTLIIDLRRNIGGNSFVASTLLSFLASQPYELLESSELRASAELKRHFLSFMPLPLRLLGVQHLHPWTRGLWQVPEGELVPISFKPYPPRKGKQKHFGGRVMILSGPGDYSSSAILLGTAKYYEMAKIVGEPSGGYPTHYGNCTRHRLDNSQLEVLIPGSINHGKGHGPVIPDQEVRLCRSDVVAGRDPVLECALGQLEAPGRR
jgi:hypothetical protein